MNRVEVKTKLRKIIREMLLSDLEGKLEVPQKIMKEILGNCGCIISEKPNQREELNSFIKSLQNWIEDSHLLLEKTCEKETDETRCDFKSVFAKYLEAEAEYCEVTSELINVLNEVIKQKEKYSEYFKSKCKAQETNVEVLNGKCQFLKLNFFYKLYGEGNALSGHLALREKLRKELDILKKNWNEVLEYNKKISEIKNDRTFNDLFKLYKELRRVEERAEIIGQI